MLNLLCAVENKYGDAKGTEISARVKVFTYKMQWDIVKILKFGLRQTEEEFWLWKRRKGQIYGDIVYKVEMFYA